MASRNIRAGAVAWPGWPLTREHKNITALAYWYNITILFFCSFLHLTLLGCNRLKTILLRSVGSAGFYLHCCLHKRLFAQGGKNGQYRNFCRLWQVVFGLVGARFIVYGRAEFLLL